MATSYANPVPELPRLQHGRSKPGEGDDRQPVKDANPQALMLGPPVLKTIADKRLAQPTTGLALPPLRPKTALRQARRQRLAATRPPSWMGRSDGPQRVTLASDDGALAFVLQVAAPDVLHVERIQRRPVGMLLVHCMRFHDAAAFRVWCEGDPVRFDDPVLFARLRRQGDDFLATAC